MSQHVVQNQTDLTNCDREPIHILGHVQSYGCLISTTSDLKVTHMSRNCADMLGIDPSDAIGQPLFRLFPSQTVHDLRSKLQIFHLGGSGSRLFGYDALGTGQRFDISIHDNGQDCVFEFEPKPKPYEEHRDDLNLVQPLIARISKATDIASTLREAATAMQLISGFDRTMIYQFAPDGAGEVIAEHCAPGMEPFLGLRYPASDIPKQARDLYRRNLLRLIWDVDGEVSPILPEQGPTGTPLDLSLTVTRAVSPIHLEYLRNMGVAASMSVSILKDGELWGLFACHNTVPRYVDFERRTAIELFAQLFSYELNRKIETGIRNEERASRELHDRLMIRISAGDDLIGGFDGIADELSHIVPNDGIAIYSNGRYTARGEAPTAEEFRRLVRFLNTTPSGQVFTTESLVKDYDGAADIGDRVAGLMAVPISNTPRDYIVFFRHEVARSVRWAGNPNKPVELGANGIRLTPRKSFEAWTEIGREMCPPWTDSELRAAEALRISLIEIVLKLTDEANKYRQAAADKQELLIAELNHRVRNILNLVQGLVSQSRTSTGSVTSFIDVLDGRIQSLARAHDQLTRDEWAPVAIRELIEVEGHAFLGTQKDRLVISGDEPLLAPEAFSAMALVLHELVTNSAKHGALADSSGKVTIDLKIKEDGALYLEWREKGGPPVQAPTRRGFGTTIIERSVPFELNGTVETRYKLGGFEADIMIPSRFVTMGTPVNTRDPQVDLPDDTAAADIPLSGTVLVVEDNMIIALDAAGILTAAGASDVRMASSVEDAIAILEKEEISAAVLDVNLGRGTSLPVALKLKENGIPFIVASGYGTVEDAVEGYPRAPVVQKPFTGETLTMKLREALSSAE